MSAREIRRDDVVRSKITGRTGPVLRVEQYDDGTPRITVEITKVAETGGPIHHFELVKSADDGRVHDVAEAERQACDEEAWRAYELLRDGIARQNAQRLAAGPSIIRRVLDAVDAQGTDPEGDEHAEPQDEPADIGEDDGPVRPVSSQAGLAGIRHGVVQPTDTAAAVIAAAMVWELAIEPYDESAPDYDDAFHDLRDAVRAHRAAIGGESWGNEPPEDEDDVDRVDPDDPTSMVVPVPGDRVLMADGGTARVTARRMDGDELSLQVQRPRMGYAEWVGVEAIAGVSEPEDDASATVETVGDASDGGGVALHESQHVALDGQDRTHRDCCVAGAVALGGHEVADGLDAHAYSGEQIPPLRDQLAQLHDEIRRPIHHMDSSSVGPEAATSGNPLIVEVNPGLASVDSSADRTGRDVPLVVSSQAGLSAIRHGVVPMDDAAGVLELAHEVVRAAHRWADTELDVPWVHDDERQRAARAGSRELRAAVRAHRAAGGGS